MSFNGAGTLLWAPRVLKLKHEIVTKTLNPIKNIQWNHLLKTSIVINWPTGWTRAEPAAGGGFIQTESSDPNDHYRPWLESNVGRQGWEWDWRMVEFPNKIASDKPIAPELDRLEIKFRNPEHATLFALTWS